MICKRTDKIREPLLSRSLIATVYFLFALKKIDIDFKPPHQKRMKFKKYGNY